MIVSFDTPKKQRKKRKDAGLRKPFTPTKEARRAATIKYELSNPDVVMLNRARHRAKKRGWEFNIERHDIVIPDICPVLKIPLVVHKEGKPGYHHDSPSLDRIDNSKGYVKGNIRVISNKANLLKSNASIEDMRLILEDMESRL